MADNYFKQWYERNKETYNHKRKLRYQSDPNVRAKAIMDARRARAENRFGTREPQPTLREVNGKEVQVFRMGDVVAATKRGEKTIRVWEQQGLIPKPSIPGKHRLYTAQQVKLLGDFAKSLEAYRYGPSRDLAVKKQSLLIHSLWTKEV